MFSDQDMGKKEQETDDLFPFLDARQFVTGEMLSWIPGLKTENPDFICARDGNQHDDNQLVGVELTKIMVDYHIGNAERLRYGEVHIDPYDTLAKIQEMIDRKEKARKDRYEKTIDDTILVLQLVDGDLDQLLNAFDGLEKDFSSHGFAEIWLVDYSGLEAYGDVEMFGLFPSQWWGFHRRTQPERKPYG